MKQIIKIRILQNTFSHKQNTLINLEEFFKYYNSLNTYTNNKEEFFDWFKTELTSIKNNTYKQSYNDISKWFDIEFEEELPLDFYYDDLIYTKEFNGFYKAWTSLAHYATRQNPIHLKTINEIEILIKESKYQSIIPHYTKCPSKFISNKL